MGAPRAIALCQCFTGALEFQAGRWDEAEAALRDSIALYRLLGAASGEALSRQRLGDLQTARGLLDEALDTFQAGVAVAERALLRAHCLARLYASMTHNRLAAGDTMLADHFLRLGLEMSQRHGNCATCDALLLPAAIDTRLAQGDPAAAEAFCRQLDAAAEQYGSRVWVAKARQARGQLAAARAAWDEAVSCYEAARAAYAATGNDYEAARCLAALAEVRRKRAADGDREAAAEARALARRLFARLGAPVA